MFEQSVRKPVLVYETGTHVCISPGLDDVIAKVLSVQIRGELVTYEVVWWNGRERIERWIDASEVRHTRSATTRQIGFLPSQADA